MFASFLIPYDGRDTDVVMQEISVQTCLAAPVPYANWLLYDIMFNNQKELDAYCQRLRDGGYRWAVAIDDTCSVTLSINKKGE